MPFRYVLPIVKASAVLQLRPVHAVFMWESASGSGSTMTGASVTHCVGTGLSTGECGVLLRISLDLAMIDYGQTMRPLVEGMRAPGTRTSSAIGVSVMTAAAMGRRLKN